MTNYEAEKETYDQLAQSPEGQAVLNPWKPLRGAPVPPPFPVDALPAELSEMARAVAANHSTPVDLPAVTGLAMLAACACGRVSVRIRENWCEPCNLYLMPVIRSGGGKTPTFKAMGQMLFDWQFAENQRRRDQIEADAARVAVWQAQKEKAIKAGNVAEAQELARTIVRFEPMRPLKRYISGNVTPEQLIAIMGENSGAVSVLDDDGGQLLDMIVGQYSQRPNLDPYLRGFDGSTIISERRSGSVALQHAHLNALTMIQPSAFDDMLLDNRAVGRGFLARFLFCTPAPSFEIGEEPDVPKTVREAYDNALRRLLDIPERRLALSLAATRCFLEWRREATRRCADEWASLFRYSVPAKLISSAVRIAGLLALFVGGDVTAATMRDGICIAEYFAAHMRLSFDGVAALAPQAKETLACLLKRGEQTQPEADVKAALKRQKLFGGADAVDVALNELAEAGYIRRTRAVGAGHTAALVELHPELLPKQSEVKLF